MQEGPGTGLGQAAHYGHTWEEMVRANSPAQLQYTGICVSFTPRHLLHT